MGFSRGALTFTCGLATRTLLFGALAVLALWLAVEPHLYATALLAGAAAVVVVADLIRHITSAERLLARFVEALAAEGEDRPAVRSVGMPKLEAAIDGALDRVSNARLLRQRRIDYLESLCDTVAAALVVIDRDGQVETANRAARLLLPAMRGLQDLGEEAARKLDSAHFGSSSVIRLKDGRVLFAIITDFTVEGERRRLLSLQRLSGDLDAIELRAWSDLVRVLSHEMMNSLTPICSLAESARSLGGEEGAEALEVIARRSAGLMNFVDRYREVFDVPSPDRRPTPLGEILSRTEALMSSQMAEASVGFTTRCEAAKVKVEVDAVLIDQAIINLLKNALEAVTGRPGAAVSLAGRIDGAHAVIEVADNGAGLLQEDVEAAFVPFFSRKPHGSGIGLAIVRQIALLHGGSVQYLPRLDGGALFRMTVPLAIAMS